MNGHFLHAPECSVGCEDFRRAARMNRREMLRAGGLAGVGLLLPELFRAQAQAKPRGSFGRAKSVIMLYLHGGHAQQETWDPKPDGPLPERGEFGAIATSVTGVRVSELMPLSARLMHKLTVLRSLSHANANHVEAALAAMTGHAHPPAGPDSPDLPPTPDDFPPLGAVLDHLRPSAGLPTWVQVGPLMRRDNGTVLHGQQPGLLGTKYSPFVINQDLRPEQVRVEAVARDAEVPVLRLESRRDLLKQVNEQRRCLDRAAEVAKFDDYQQKALQLLSSNATARAFDLASEPAALRDRYGRTQFGQCCLLARRLAEAGVPMINVHYCHTPAGSWDTHSKHFSQMKTSLAPTLDRAFTSLVEDLDERGLLGQTLVLATAEFGRTPKINANAGRDHWPWVYSVAMAGGGMKPGVVLGSSDKIAAFPTSHPHEPADLMATIYHLLGIAPETQIHDRLHRPHRVVIGRTIAGLLA